MSHLWRGGGGKLDIHMYLSNRILVLRGISVTQNTQTPPNQTKTNKKQTNPLSFYIASFFQLITTFSDYFLITLSLFQKGDHGGVLGYNTTPWAAALKSNPKLCTYFYGNWTGIRECPEPHLLFSKFPSISKEDDWMFYLQLPLPPYLDGILLSWVGEKKDWRGSGLATLFYVE